MCITSLLSVSTRSNRAAVAGNCNSLLPGAARVQSRIHEFLVRSPSSAFLLRLHLHLRLYSSVPCHTAWSSIFCVPYVHCARRISHTQNWRKKSLDINQGRAYDDRKCKVYRFYTYYLVHITNRYLYCLQTEQWLNGYIVIPCISVCVVDRIFRNSIWNTNTNGQRVLPIRRH